MIDESVLDRIIPLPDEDEKMEEIQAELVENGFPLTSFKKGGIIYHLLRLSVTIYIELIELARTILNSCFFQHAEGDWLDIKAADVSKSRIEATKTIGYVTVYRSEYDQALKITKGHGFKTEPDATGNEYKFYAVEDTVIAAGASSGTVLVEAAEPGTAYNIAANTITVSMIYLDGMDHVNNNVGWLYLEGADAESDDALRARGMASWSELASQTIDEKLKNAALSVPGVIGVSIDSQHPRGQGTVDIIITSTAGTASSTLIEEVQDVVDELADGYSNFLVKSATVTTQAINVTVYLGVDVSTEGAAAKAKELIVNTLDASRDEANTLYRDQIIQVLSNNIAGYRKMTFTAPAADIELAEGNVIITTAAQVAVTVTNIQRS